MLSIHNDVCSAKIYALFKEKGIFNLHKFVNLKGEEFFFQMYCIFMSHEMFVRSCWSQSESQIRCTAESRVQRNDSALQCNAESPFSGQKSKDVGGRFVFTSAAA